MGHWQRGGGAAAALEMSDAKSILAELQDNPVQVQAGLCAACAGRSFVQLRGVISYRTHSMGLQYSCNL